jgi:hypothetical protein
MKRSPYAQSSYGKSQPFCNHPNIPTSSDKNPSPFLFPRLSQSQQIIIRIIFETSRLSRHNRSAHVTLLHEQSTQPGSQSNATIENHPIRRDFNILLRAVDLPTNFCFFDRHSCGYSGVSERTLRRLRLLHRFEVAFGIVIFDELMRDGRAKAV